VEAPNLSRIGLSRRKESGFRRISFFFARVIFFFFSPIPERLNPKSMLASCKLKGGSVQTRPFRSKGCSHEATPANPGLTRESEPGSPAREPPCPRRGRQVPASKLASV